MTDEERQRVSDPLAIAWLRDMAHADETCPEEPTDDGHARNALDAIERRDDRIANMEREIARIHKALRCDPNSDAASLADTLAARAAMCDELEEQVRRWREAMPRCGFETGECAPCGEPAIAEGVNGTAHGNNRVYRCDTHDHGINERRGLPWAHLVRLAAPSIDGAGDALACEPDQG